MFKALSFSNLNNVTIFQELQKSLQSMLHFAVDAVYLYGFYFDINDYLITPVQFFPNDNVAYYEYPEIMIIGSFLANQQYKSPPGLIPYLFQDNPYCFRKNMATLLHALGLFYKQLE